jgi:EgtB-related family protein
LSHAHTQAYLRDTLTLALEKLQDVPTAQLYFWDLALRHEAMHIEAGMMAAHMLATPKPIPDAVAKAAPRLNSPQDVAFEATQAQIGADPSNPSRFVFDNEKWQNDVTLPAFAMRNTLTQNGEYAAFLDATGYAPPAHWRRSGTHGFELRAFDAWAPMDAPAALVGVSALDAQAYCDWAQRRLPTEFEWEHAVRTHPDLFSDAFGVAWQWTASAFAPYRGFAADPYQDYSQPWFDGEHRTLRGSSFATQACLSHAGFRNFYLPHRTDVFAGFRTCAP